MYNKSFTIEKRVPQRALDDLEHVNNVVYLQWAQEVSAEHWKTAVPEAIRSRAYWVVLSHFIEYKKPAYQDDLLNLTTWVKSMEGVKSERHVEVRRKKDDLLLAKVQTVWCLIDGKNHRPKRIPEEIMSIFL